MGPENANATLSGRGVAGNVDRPRQRIITTDNQRDQVRQQNIYAKRQVSDCSPGSHPHSDRPNWQPATELGDYFTNCRDGLEKWSERRVAELLECSRIEIWRAKLASQVPEDLVERIFEWSRTKKKKFGVRGLAHVGQFLTEKGQAADRECCPNCGFTLRVRYRVPKDVLNIIADWADEQAVLCQGAS